MKSPSKYNLNFSCAIAFPFLLLLLVVCFNCGGEFDWSCWLMWALCFLGISAVPSNEYRNYLNEKRQEIKQQEVIWEAILAEFKFIDGTIYTIRFFGSGEFYDSPRSNLTSWVNGWPWKSCRVFKDSLRMRKDLIEVTFKDDGKHKPPYSIVEFI